MIIEVLSSGPAETNAYLIGCEKTGQAVLIDAPFECADWVDSTLKNSALELKSIWLTHSHWDHIAEAALLKDKFNVPVYVHREDAENLEKPGSDRLPLLIPVRGVAPDGYLEEGQLLHVGALQANVIHTPGHSPGCVCFYFAGEKTLFSGDTLFSGAIGRLDFPTSKPHLMRSSLKRLAALPLETIVYPGHGEATTIGEEQWMLLHRGE